MSINKIINFKENVPPSVKTALSKVGNNKINNAFYGRVTQKPKILLFKNVEKNIENCLLNYLFKE